MLCLISKSVTLSDKIVKITSNLPIPGPEIKLLLPCFFNFTNLSFFKAYFFSMSSN